MSACEFNFDGLVGPTHNYSGLAYGNTASVENQSKVSNPRKAATQGLRKMKALHDLGVPQAVLPPQERPAVDVLRRLGFSGSDHDLVRQARRDAPSLLAACCSASGMWVANAATVSPSADSVDGKVHFTPANLHSNFHRHIEVPTTARVLQAVFSNPDYFVHHAPLPSVPLMGDEGAANHSRFCANYGSAGVQLFAYGNRVFGSGSPMPARFPSRQTFEASQAISRLHQLNLALVVFAQQHPDAIDAGVFHNDVIAVGNQHVFFVHEHAFVEQTRLREEIQAKFGSVALEWIEVTSDAVSLEDAVASYLFNSQLVTLPSDGMALVVPEECQSHERVWSYLQGLAASHDIIETVEVFDLRESMQNGGGPACLRLRVVLTDEEAAQVKPSVLFDDTLHEKLKAWIDTHYREELREDDFADPVLLDQSRTALDELTQLLDLGSIYPFQLG